VKLRRLSFIRGGHSIHNDVLRVVFLSKTLDTPLLIVTSGCQMSPVSYIWSLKETKLMNGRLS